jgi:hypothetical protein
VVAPGEEQPAQTQGEVSPATLGDGSQGPQMAKLTVRSNIGPRPRAHLCHAGSERTALPVQPLAAVGYADPRGGIKTPIREQGNDRRARGADRTAPIDAFERPVDRSHAELDDVSPEASWHLRVASQNYRRAVASERVAV